MDKRAPSDKTSWTAWS